MSILSKLQSLLSAANTATGESDTTITDAMQTLIDGYGQGGISTEYTYLDTFNITEDVHQLTIDISSYDYGEYLLTVNASGTGADYLYFSIASSGTNSNFVYIAGNTYSKTLLISIRRPGTYGESGNITSYYANGIATATNVVYPGTESSSTKPSVIRIFAYRSAGVINTGSTFTLYGRN